MVLSREMTYEKIYYTLWECGQRYREFAQFRVIGQTHDDRMIPMLELGTGEYAVFLMAGTDSGEPWISCCLTEMIGEYCSAFECGWKIDEEYPVRELLEQYRFCFIPMVNPDGYELYIKGYSAIRNPIYRQMLKMREETPEDAFCNARGVNLRNNFPTGYYQRKRLGQEPASENETKALIRIFQEYRSLGLLSFCYTGKKIYYYRHPQAFSCNQKSIRMARHLQKNTCYSLGKIHCDSSASKDHPFMEKGSPEQYYMEITKRPAFLIEAPCPREDSIPCFQQDQEYRELRKIPLEYLLSWKKERL